MKLPPKTDAMIDAYVDRNIAERDTEISRVAFDEIYRPALKWHYWLAERKVDQAEAASALLTVMMAMLHDFAAANCDALSGDGPPNPHRAGRLFIMNMSMAWEEAYRNGEHSDAKP